MSTTGRNAQSPTAQLLWGVRSLAWLWVPLMVTAGVVAPLALSAEPTRYEARSLVVAEQLELRAELLPRYGEAIFGSGAVARQVALDYGINASPDDLVPEHLEVVTALDSVVLTVIGRDENPETAARLANLAAEAFVLELNKAGPGVGTFDLQHAAAVPAEPASSAVSTPVAAGIGLLAGAVLSLGLVALLVALRKPVVEPELVDPSVGVPIVEVVELPRSRVRYPGPRGVRGVASVTRWVLATDAVAVLLVSDNASRRARRRIAVMVALALQRVRPLDLDPLEPDLREAVSRHPDFRRSQDQDDVVSRPIAVMDGADPLDLVEMSERMKVATVLVVPQGVPQGALRRICSEFLEDELDGVVLYRTVRSKRRRVTGQERHEPPALRHPAHPAGDVPEEDAADRDDVPAATGRAAR